MITPSIIGRYICARFAKIFGNFLKGPFFLVHALLPHKRFTIPHQSKPLISVASNRKIPKIIWQTNYTDRVTLAVYVNYLFNRLMSPTYEYRFMDDTDRANFIAQYYSPRIREAYSRLQIGAAQADLWRILILQQFGGVYLDIDAHLVWPLEFIIKPEYKELYLQHKRNVLSNYFVASTGSNSNLDLVITAIVNNIESFSTNDVANLTGPGVLDKMLGGLNVPRAGYRYTCYQGTFTNKFFQYVDHPQGTWSEAQKHMDIVANGTVRPLAS
jgi:mannosyltransferase OCH1-like enzyme